MSFLRIGSVTKLFPSIMAYQCEESGLVKSLDDPLVMYAPGFSIKDPFGTGGKQVTYRSMMGQVSGLQREPPLGNLANFTTAQALESLKDMYLLFPSYTQPSYSNLAFGLIGRTLESVVKTTFEDYCQKEIIDVLKMKNTGFDYTPDVINRLATGYVGTTGIAQKPGAILGWTGPAGNAYSTISDLGILLDSFLSEDNDILQSGTKREMIRPLFLNQNRLSGFGTPWEVQIIAVNNSTSLVVPTKGGNVGGYSTLVVLGKFLRDYSVFLKVIFFST